MHRVGRRCGLSIRYRLRCGPNAVVHRIRCRCRVILARKRAALTRNAIIVSAGIAVQPVLEGLARRFETTSSKGGEQMIGCTSGTREHEQCYAYDQRGAKCHSVFSDLCVALPRSLKRQNIKKAGTIPSDARKAPPAEGGAKRGTAT